MVIMTFVLEGAFQNGVTCVILKLIAKIMLILLNTELSIKLLKSQLRSRALSHLDFWLNAHVGDHMSAHLTTICERSCGYQAERLLTFFGPLVKDQMLDKSCE